MAKKSLKEIKSMIYLLGEDINTVIEKGKLYPDAEEELRQIAEKMYLINTKDEEDFMDVDDFRKDINEAKELSSFCAGAADEIDLIVQKYGIDGKWSEKLEDVSMDLSVAVRQLRDVKNEKEKEKSKRNNKTLDEYIEKQQKEYEIQNQNENYDENVKKHEGKKYSQTKLFDDRFENGKGM